MNVDESGTLAGIYFSDRNRNGIRDGQENVIPNATISVVKDEINMIRPTIDIKSDVNGAFRFTDLEPGNYDLFVRDAPSSVVVSQTLTQDQDVEELNGFENPSAIAVGFLDADLRPEAFILQAATQSRDDLVIVLSEEDGVMRQVLEQQVLPDPQLLVVSDFNDDGFSDFAVSAASSSLSAPPGSDQTGAVQIFLNNQQGEFDDPTVLNLGRLPRGLVASDLDGDGDIDLAVANSFSASVTVLANDGNGAFSSVSTFDTEAAPERLVATDLDGDALPDLVVANLSGSLTVAINASITPDVISFGNVHMIGAESSVTEVIADRFFDANGDGKVDELDPLNIVTIELFAVGRPQLVVRDASFDVIQTVRLVNKASQQATSQSPSTITTGDFDGDGDLDIAIAATQLNGSPFDVLVVPNQAMKHFTELTREDPGASLGFIKNSSIASGDFDLDGDVDFVVGHQNGSELPLGSAALLRTRPSPGNSIPITLTELGDGANQVMLPRPPDFVVDSAGDGGDSDLTDGVAMASDGSVTLRAAIEQANETANDLTIIEFDLPIDADLIRLASPLPPATTLLLLDAGTSLVHIQAGAEIDHLLELGVGSTLHGIKLTEFVDFGVTLADTESTLRQPQVASLDQGQVRLERTDLFVFPERLVTTELFSADLQSIGRLRFDSTVAGRQISVGAGLDHLTGEIELAAPEGPALKLNHLDQELDLTAVAHDDLRGIESIDLTDPTSHQLILDDSNVRNLPSDNSLRVELGTDDVLMVRSRFRFAQAEIADGRLEHIFAEDDAVLVVAGPKDWSNPIDRFDVNGNNEISAVDALIVINELSRKRFSEPTGAFIDLALAELSDFQFFDVNRNDGVSAIDALQVINELSRRTNRISPESMGMSPFQASPSLNRDEDASIPFATRANRLCDDGIDCESPAYSLKPVVFSETYGWERDVTVPIDPHSDSPVLQRSETVDDSLECTHTSDCVVLTWR